MKITKDFVKSLSPCNARWTNYMTYYNNWSGTLLEFLELDLSIEDKLSVFCRPIPDLERLQRMFAVRCALRAAEQSGVKEIINFAQLIIVLYQENDFNSNIEIFKEEPAYSAAINAVGWAAYSAADSAAINATDWAAYSAADRAADRAAYWAAYSAAYWAADSAAYRAAERKIQLDILISIIEG